MVGDRIAERGFGDGLLSPARAGATVARASLLYVGATTAATVVGAPNRYLIIDTSRL
jgi:hypothetical protein